jgi:hypothetical protein
MQMDERVERAKACSRLGRDLREAIAQVRNYRDAEGLVLNPSLMEIPSFGYSFYNSGVTAGTCTNASTAAAPVTLDSLKSVMDQFRKWRDEDPLHGVREMKRPTMIVGENVDDAMIQRLEEALGRRLEVNRTYTVPDNHMFFLDAAPPELEWKLPELDPWPAEPARKYRSTRRGRLRILHRHRKRRSTHQVCWRTP